MSLSCLHLVSGLSSYGLRPDSFWSALSYSSLSFLSSVLSPSLSCPSLVCFVFLWFLSCLTTARGGWGWVKGAGRSNRIYGRHERQSGAKKKAITFRLLTYRSVQYAKCKSHKWHLDRAMRMRANRRSGWPCKVTEVLPGTVCLLGNASCRR